MSEQLISISPTALFLRDFTVSVYAIAATLQLLMLVTALRELYRRRTRLFGMASVLCMFGLASAVSSFIYSTDVNAYCAIRGRLNGTLHLLSLTTIELILLAKVRAVNTGQERKVFTAVGLTWILLRLGSSLANVILLRNERIGGVNGVCVSIFEPYSTYALNVTVVGTNLSLSFMFIYPLRAHIRRMWKAGVDEEGGKGSVATGFYEDLVAHGIRYSIMQSMFSTVAYTVMALSLLGKYSIAILYLDWCFANYCTVAMLLDSVNAATRRTNGPQQRNGPSSHQLNRSMHKMTAPASTVPPVPAMEKRETRGYVPGTYTVFEVPGGHMKMVNPLPHAPTDISMPIMLSSVHAGNAGGRDAKKETTYNVLRGL